jgi:hypothetical protein
MPDQANALSSGKDIEEACRSLLNLLMRVIFELIASASFEVALLGIEG